MKDSRILLLNPPWKAPILRDYYCTSVSKAGYLWPPVDLMAQAGRLRAAGFEVMLIDAVAARLDARACLERIDSFDPATVVLLTSPLSAPEDDILAASLGARRLIATGEAPFGDPGRYLVDHPSVSAVLADFTADGLLRFIQGERTALEGLWWRDDGTIFPGAPARRGRFHMPPLAHDLLTPGDYRMPLLGGAVFATVPTDFGCPHRCRFCNSGSRGHRLRAIKDVAAELDLVSSLGFRHVFIKDMSFGSSRGHALEVCALLRERHLGWHAYARADDLDADLARTMADSGCRLVQIGVESGDERLRKAYGKPVTDQAVDLGISACRNAGMLVGLHLVLGIQGEDLRSLTATRRLLARLRPDYVSINIATYRAGSAVERESAGGTGLAGDERLLQLVRTLLYVDFYLNPGWIMAAIRRTGSSGDFLDLVRSGMWLAKSQMISAGTERRWLKRLRTPAG